jgi:hypothetical protein
LKSAGLVAERKQANKVMYSLVAERLAVPVRSFLSAVCPDQPARNRRGKKKSKAPDKPSFNKPSIKRKRKVSTATRAPEPAETGGRVDAGPELVPEALSATE